MNAATRSKARTLSLFCLQLLRKKGERQCACFIYRPKGQSTKEKCRLYHCTQSINVSVEGFAALTKSEDKFVSFTLQNKPKTNGLEPGLRDIASVTSASQFFCIAHIKFVCDNILKHFRL